MLPPPTWHLGVQDVRQHGSRRLNGTAIVCQLPEWHVWRCWWRCAATGSGLSSGISAHDSYPLAWISFTSDLPSCGYLHRFLCPDVLESLWQWPGYLDILHVSRNYIQIPYILYITIYLYYVYRFYSSKSLRTPSNLLILNLAVFDLFMCSNMPHYLVNAALGYIAGGDLGCDIYALNGGISGMGASITNAFIAFDRYKTISNPIDGRLSYGQIILCILFTWVWATPFSVLPLTQIWGRYRPGMLKISLIVTFLLIILLFLRGLPDNLQLWLSDQHRWEPTLCTHHIRVVLRHTDDHDNCLVL